MEEEICLDSHGNVGDDGGWDSVTSMASSSKLDVTPKGSFDDELV